MSTILRGRRAILYSRVSTTEQADRGYSLRDQQAQLESLCRQQQVEIVQSFVEDCSAKTFERPEWKKLLAYVEKHRGKVDLILVVKWDRFSRNVHEAYSMLARLRKLGVEVQAIQQFLDFKVPESKIMLAIYLAQPEVDNDRRSLNTISGMRRSRKEGRWAGTAPYGYRFEQDLSKKPMLVINEPKATYVRNAFKRLAEGLTPTRTVFRDLAKNGMKLSYSSFHRMIENSVYYGVIYIPAFDNEPEVWAKGLHTPLVSEEVWREANTVKSGKHRTKKLKYERIHPEIPLRRLLQCPDCLKPLTGSASRGRNGTAHYYYHCNRCGVRFRAEVVHMAFITYLRRLKVSDEIVISYKRMLEASVETLVKSKESKASTLRKELDEVEARLLRTSELFVEGELGRSEHDALLERYRSRKRVLSDELLQLDSSDTRAEQYLELGLKLLLHPDEYYQRADYTLKPRIVGSIIGESLVFDGEKFRTAVESTIAGSMSLRISNLERITKQKSLETSDLLHIVTRTGLEPVQPP